MQIDSSDTSNEKETSQSIKIDKDNIICKDGFCSLPNQNNNKRINDIDNQFFDPI